MDIDFTAASCASWMEVKTDGSENGAFKLLPKIYGRYRKMSGKVNGNVYYERMFQGVRYGIWRCNDGSWSIGLSTNKNKTCRDNTRVAKTQRTPKNSYKCPNDTKLNWQYYNNCAQIFYPVLDSLKVKSSKKII